MRRSFSLLIIISVIGGLALFQNCGKNGAQMTGLSSVAASRAIDVVPPEHPPVEGEIASKTTYEPLLADRYYLQSLFTDVFGPGAQTLIERAGGARLFTDVGNNGSPCGAYQHHAKLNGSGALVSANPMEVCTIRSVNRLTGRVNPNPTVSRAAQIARACSDLTANDSTLRFALSRIGAVQPDLPLPTEENLIAVFHLFYRNSGEPTPAVLQSLALMLTPGATTMDEWRSVIYTVCASSHWQVL